MLTMFGRSASARSLALIVGGVALLTMGAAPPPAVQSPFAAIIARLSERAGYFDTDNLISNETSYSRSRTSSRTPRRRAASTWASDPSRTSATSRA